MASGTALSLSMKGDQLVRRLCRGGFVVRRRASSYVWLEQGEQKLLVDEARDVEDAVAERILGEVQGTIPPAPTPTKVDPDAP